MSPFFRDYYTMHTRLLFKRALKWLIRLYMHRFSERWLCCTHANYALPKGEFCQGGTVIQI